MNDTSYSAGEHRLTVDTAIYSLEAIKKTAYKFASRASILINPGQGTSVVIVFVFVGKQSENNPEQVLADFSTELLDQDLREIIKRETTPVRNVILAHAFSRTSLIDQG